MGGVETHVREVVRRLAEHDVQTAVLTADPTGELAPETHVDGVPVRRVRAWPRHGDLFFAPAVATQIRDGNWDLVHIQSYHTLVAPLAMLAAARAGVPYVLTFHAGGHSSPLRTAIRGPQLLALRPLLARAERLVAVAAWEVEHYGRLLRLPPERFEVIPNGGDLPAPADLPTPEPDDVLIVSMGRLERYKGHQHAIAALPYVVRELPAARLWVAGDGPYRPQLERLAAELGVAERVEIASVTDRGALARRLAGARVVTMLSDFETHPIGALEAMALGVPVVVANNSGLAELADKGLATPVIPARGPSHVAAALIEQVRSPRRVRGVTLPTWDDCAARLATLYRLTARR